MHILTGLFLSKLISGRLADKKFKGFKGIIEIRHQITGRVRYFIPMLKGESKNCQLLKNQLEKADVISLAQPNPLIGSLLVEFDSANIAIETMTAVIVKILGLEEAVEKTPDSVMNKELSEFIKSVNSSIFEHTNGLMDLKSLVTTTFLSLGIYSLFKSRNNLPSGLSLLYWAYMNIQKGKN